MNMPVVKVCVLDNFLHSYTYDLPKEAIAQFPLMRGQSRLCVVDMTHTDFASHEQGHGLIKHAYFDDLPSVLPKNALLIANNSRVVPTRLLGQRPTGGRIECLLLTPLPQIVIEASMHPVLGACFSACVDALIKPAKHAPVGLSFSLASDAIHVDVLEKSAFGKCSLRLYWQENLEDLLEVHGHLPLPPYIHRKDQVTDRKNYQTSYALHSGSIAAPTAGLHFTPIMCQRLLDTGFEWAELTLHVGYGTFAPVRCEDIREHAMHPEYVVFDALTCKRIIEAKIAKRPIIAVGTTVARALEGIIAIHGGQLAPYTGFINIFISPGFTFRILDGLLTNFHLPESTLLMLVASLLGRERTLAIYAEAVRKGYRFFSYGDAMLIR